MGRYLVIDGRETNSNSLASAMSCLIYDLLPGKRKESTEEKFSLDTKDVAILLDGAATLEENHFHLIEYSREHKNSRVFDGSFSDVVATFADLRKVLSHVLCDMVLEDRGQVVCEWV